MALRQARGSGADGLAGMAPVRELAGLRLLRPLLAVPKAALVALLAAAGQPWLEDPSNRAACVRPRPTAPGPALDVARWRGLARHVRRACARDRAVAAWLAQHARIFPAGFVLPGAAGARRGAARVARAGPAAGAARGRRQAYAPRRARLDRLLEALRARASARGRTLGGCRMLRRGERLLICREPGAISEVLAPRRASGTAGTGASRCASAARSRACGCAALGADGWRQRAAFRRRRRADLPAASRAEPAGALAGRALLAVPQLGLIAPGRARRLLEARYRPPQPLAGAPFARRAFAGSMCARGEEIFASRSDRLC